MALAVAAGAVGAGPDSGLIVAGRDGGLRVWDFRGGATQRLARHPQFQVRDCVRACVGVARAYGLWQIKQGAGRVGWGVRSCVW